MSFNMQNSLSNTNNSIFTRLHKIHHSREKNNLELPNGRKMVYEGVNVFEKSPKDLAQLGGLRGILKWKN